ncbi:phage holin family protein [Caldalkalibacillus mannanilyticus]|uniref:phage holin family protein n=1 Tax=Caldalkalibacillus mannanilyticus TaxID=1418 RepID=UPI00046917C0|nr:phage holin family protein [Caldalkalibacillus mannanilyticus]
MTFMRHLIRFIVAAIVLLTVSWLIPAFTIVGFWNAFLAAIVIAAIGWGIELMMGDRISLYSRGIVGFLVSAVVIYFAQFFIVNFQTTFMGALLAAAVIGIVDLFVPIKPRFGSAEGARER